MAAPTSVRGAIAAKFAIADGKGLAKAHGIEARRTLVQRIDRVGIPQQIDRQLGGIILRRSAEYHPQQRVEFFDLVREIFKLARASIRIDGEVMRIGAMPRFCRRNSICPCNAQKYREHRNALAKKNRFHL